MLFSSRIFIKRTLFFQLFDEFLSLGGGHLFCHERGDELGKLRFGF